MKMIPAMTKTEEHNTEKTEERNTHNIIKIENKNNTDEDISNNNDDNDNTEINNNKYKRYPDLKNHGKQEFLEIDPTKQGYKTRNNFIQTATAVMFTQMQAKFGVQQFGEEEFSALIK